MKKLILTLAIAIFSFGGEYYGVQEPIKTHIFASKVSGSIVFINDKASSTIAKNEAIVKIDDEVSKANYALAKDTYEIQKDTYEKVRKMSTKSKTQKDQEKINFLKSKQAFVTAKDDLNARTIKAKGLYVSDILVKEGQFVNPGTVLFKAYDYSRSKLTVYVSKQDIKNIKNKKITVNGKEGDFKLSKVYNIADETYISSYKIELIGPSPKRFSNLLKVEIK